MSSKSWTSEMPPAESGELLNRKLSSCLSWSTLILSPTRSRGREATVCYTSSWASVKEVICTESSKNRRGSFCLRVRWWNGLFRSLWLCRYCPDTAFHLFQVMGMAGGFLEMLPQMFTWRKIHLWSGPNPSRYSMRVFLNEWCLCWTRHGFQFVGDASSLFV